MAQRPHPRPHSMTSSVWASSEVGLASRDGRWLSIGVRREVKSPTKSGCAHGKPRSGQPRAWTLARRSVLIEEGAAGAPRTKSTGMETHDGTFMAEKLSGRCAG